MVWSCEKGNGVRRVEIGGRNGCFGGKGNLRKTWKDIVKRDLELLVVDENVALDRRRWRKILARLTPT